MKKDLVIEKGSTFTHLVRWATEVFTYKAITGITQAAPARVTSTAHGIPDGWKVALVSVKGMREISAEENPPATTDYKIATLVDADHVELNAVNSSEFTAYTSGGYIQFKTPVDMTGYTASFKVYDRAGGTELLSLTTANSGVLIDNTKKLITITMSATATQALVWKKGVYEFYMISQDGVVTELLTGNISVID